MISVSDLPFLPPSQFLHPPRTSQINTVSTEKEGKQHRERLQPKGQQVALSQHIKCLVLLTDVVQILNQKPGLPPPTTLYSLNIIKQ